MGATIDKATEDVWVGRIALGEGFSPTRNPDPSGKGYCVGYGHNLTTSGRGPTWVKQMTGKDIDKGDSLTRADADKMCREDLKTVYAALDKHLPWWRDLDPTGQYVMVDMCYTMGIGGKGKDGKIHGLLGFPNMLSALKAGDYQTASQEIIKSKYYNDTTGRAARNSEFLRTGEWRELDCMLKGKSPYKDSQGRWVVRDPQTGKRYNYEDHPSRGKGQDVTKEQVKKDTQKAKDYEVKKVDQVRQATAPAQTKAQPQAAPQAQTKAQPQATPQAQTKAQPQAAPKAQTKAQPQEAPRSAPAKTGNATDKDRAKMRSMLNKLNAVNGKNKQVDVDATMEALINQFGPDASKVLAKAMMAPSTVSKKLGLTSENGKQMWTSREVITKLCNLDNQQRQQAVTLVIGKKHDRSM